ncbi:hypothetical protein N658DRAFT_168477 [Parathielavia hyrcaniae]|uniref:Uncharacterized protein n=1 Tax=Parathielavia hyrcaniae TaxID=113614 RepID=A0AAN6SZA8_9PEZI|nr:hypothetical protein N658DRAFT_168477 [Parathielavia hyrcaniae]
MGVTVGWFVSHLASPMLGSMELIAVAILLERFQKASARIGGRRRHHDARLVGFRALFLGQSTSEVDGNELINGYDAMACGGPLGLRVVSFAMENQAQSYGGSGSRQFNPGLSVRVALRGSSFMKGELERERKGKIK